MMRTTRVVCGIFHIIFTLLHFSSGEVGEGCILKSGVNGSCQLISDCPSAREDLKRGLRPVSCGFYGKVPIVCCPVSVPSSTEDSPTLIENIRKSPGDAAKFWCEKYLEICSTAGPILPTINAFTLPIIQPLQPLPLTSLESIELIGPIQPSRIEPIISRSQRDASATEMPDYDDFGTTEMPQIEITTVKSDDNPIVPVVGGKNTTLDEFPHMAAIGYGGESNVKWLCGGSLISEKFVLTAAHCLHSQNDGPAQWVRLGADILSDELRTTSASATKGQTHRVVRRIRHPGYRPPSKYHDVALIEIGPTVESSPLSTMSKTLHPACLQVEEAIDATQVVATGWGRLGYYDDVSANLQKVELNILEKSICNKTYEYEIKWSSLLKRGMDDSVICAGVLSGGKDTCLGDSGGPLQILLAPGYCKYKVVAITSFGKVCGFTNSPAVYMSVSYYIPWIESIVWPES